MSRPAERGPTPGAAPGTTAGVVLAAGAARRMGRNKMLLELEGEPLVARAARRALEAGLAPVIVVTGDEEARVRSALAGLPCRCVTSPDPAGPTSASLHAALHALEDDAGVTAALVLLGDMVHVTADMLRRVADPAFRGDARLAVSRYGDVLAPPVLFTRALWPELLAWTGEGCGKPVVRAHRDEAAVREWPGEALEDVDTPEDWERLTGPTGR